MIMAFVLIVIVDGTPLPDEFYFRNIHRCNQFAHYIEHGSRSPKDRRQIDRQLNISAYCLPRRLPNNSRFWD